LTWSPEWNWSRFRTSCHPDHRATGELALTTGELALTAVYPDAGNPFAHAHLLEDEGLEPWDVTEIWLINGRESNHYVDITDTFERKIAALRAHASQIGAPGLAGGADAGTDRAEHFPPPVFRRAVRRGLPSCREPMTGCR